MQRVAIMLPRDLLRPAAYPPPRPQRIELRETHASWVFLTEGEVFKVKKPVDLGFLDFRGIDARRRACESEVVLNARLAAGVYLGVRPVRERSDGSYHLGAEGRIVDWAVHMMRLPDAARADVRLPSGEEIDRLARHLEAFHARARCDEETSRFGEVDAVAANVRENFAQTSWQGYVRPEDEREIESWQLGFLVANAPLFEARVGAGKVRDGHGDLRLEHVYFGEQGEITIIDCIEFADRFRYADVCSDVAFLAMDLASHGRVDLAERLVAKYAREADDFDLYGVIDFYESYRAYVRAKVSALLAIDSNADDDARAQAARSARKHLLLALSAGRRWALKPQLVCVGGVIASGKSTLAEGIGEKLGAPVVDADRTRKHVMGVSHFSPIHDEAWSGAYDPRITERVYAEVLRRADVVLASGRPAVIDASFRSREMRASARDLAKKHGVPFRFVECRAPREVCLRRLEAREQGLSVSDGRRAIFDAFVARVEPPTELPDMERVTVDTTRPIEASLAYVTARLGCWPQEVQTRALGA